MPLGRAQVARADVTAAAKVRPLKQGPDALARADAGRNGIRSAPPTRRAGRDGAHAATIAAVLATPCQNTELTPEAADIGLVRAAVLCLINRKRAEAGESPLCSTPSSNRPPKNTPRNWSRTTTSRTSLPAARPRSIAFVTPATSPTPSVGYVIGENLAWGTYQLSTPQAIVSAWIASPGHLANILEAQYVDTGHRHHAAVPPSLAAGAPGATYAQEFGVIVQ